MPARQIWVFLTEEDVAKLHSELERRDPGVVLSEGRYLKGEPRDLIDDPTRLERRQALPGERRYYLLHRKHSSDVVTHRQSEGPFAGWSQIDEERTDCLVLRVPSGPVGTLGPAQLYAYVLFWRAGEKTRKRPKFSIWASQTLKHLSGLYPPTGVRFMRIGPDALARALGQELGLTYLYRPIRPEPGQVPESSAGPEPLPAPEGLVTPESPDD